MRNHIVAPLGLKTPAPHRIRTVDAIGVFAVLSETPHCIVAGFDDKHLDFRVVVQVAAELWRLSCHFIA